jgi:hypothetical protein
VGNFAAIENVPVGILFENTAFTLRKIKHFWDKIIGFAFLLLLKNTNCTIAEHVDICTASAPV